jgi:Holliday junction resolvasome RuvABC endonuclease subunit
MTGTSKEWDGGLLSGEASSLIYVGIDQSYTGFGITLLNEQGLYYTWVYKSDYKGVDRLLDISKFLESILLDHMWRVKDVAIEAPVRMSHSALMSGELLAVVKLACRRLFGRTDPGYPIQVPPSTLKKYASNNGRADKREVIKAVRDTWGADFGTNDNAADSYVLARMASKWEDNKERQDIIQRLSQTKFKDPL